MSGSTVSPAPIGATEEEWDNISSNPELLPDLLPVCCDKSVPISPTSTLKELGKVPSLIGSTGRAHGISNWSNRTTTIADVAEWRKDRRLGICVQTRNHKVFDVDVEDKELSIKIEDILRPLIAEMAGMNLDDVPLRWRDNSSKFAILVACGTVMPKRLLKLRGGSGKIEFLGNGQHCVIAGTHPSGARIHWECFPAKLPPVTDSHIDVIWSHLRDKLGDLIESASAGQPVPGDDFMRGREPRLGLSAEEIEELVAKLDPDCPRDDWIRVGMSLHHECEGDDTGFEIWDSWSSLGAKYVSEEDLRKDWNSFERRQGGGPNVTMRSVLKMVNDVTPVATTEELERAAQEGGSLAKSAKGYDGRFPFRSAAEMANAPPLEWLVKGIIPRADIVMLYGPSGSGKTFVALQIAAAIARGVEWRGRRVIRGRVVIIAAEGGGSYSLRLQAYARQAGIDIADLDIGVCTVPPNFCRREDIIELAKAIVATGGADFIVVDTLAQVTPGANENSGEDMGLALAHARALREATGAVVMIVHHSGKDTARGARGWSGLKGSVDAALEVTRHSNGNREIHVDKMRDGQDGLRFDFRLQVVDMGTDHDGDPLTSCVVIDVDRQQESPLRKGPSGKAQKAILQIVLQLGGNTVVGAALADVIAAIIEQKGPPLGRDNRATNARRDIKKLVAEGFLFERVERLYIADGVLPNGVEVDA